MIDPQARTIIGLIFLAIVGTFYGLVWLAAWWPRRKQKQVDEWIADLLAGELKDERK